MEQEIILAILYLIPIFLIILATINNRKKYDKIHGDRGSEGQSGQRGAQGVQGNTGLQGVQGLKGLRGDQGPKGDQGPSGVVGVQGRAGATGLVGFAGPIGLSNYNSRPVFSGGLLSGSPALVASALYIPFNTLYNQLSDTVTVYNNNSLQFKQSGGTFKLDYSLTFVPVVTGVYESGVILLGNVPQTTKIAVPAGNRNYNISGNWIFSPLVNQTVGVLLNILNPISGVAYTVYITNFSFNLTKLV